MQRCVKGNRGETLRVLRGVGCRSGPPGKLAVWRLFRTKRKVGGRASEGLASWQGLSPPGDRGVPGAT